MSSAPGADAPLGRGQIVLVALDPAVGPEQGKTRPAVVVSNNASNTAASRNAYGVVTIVPLTSNTEHVWPYQVLIRSDDSGLPRDSKAQVEQLRAVSSTRITRAIGWLPAPLLAELDEAMRLHLSL